MHRPLFQKGLGVQKSNRKIFQIVKVFSAPLITSPATSVAESNVGTSGMTLRCYATVVKDAICKKVFATFFDAHTYFAV